MKTRTRTISFLLLIEDIEFPRVYFTGMQITIM